MSSADAPAQNTDAKLAELLARHLAELTRAPRVGRQRLWIRFGAFIGLGDSGCGRMGCDCRGYYKAALCDLGHARIPFVDPACADIK